MENQNLQIGKPASVANQRQTNPPKRILVVDDDSEVRQLSAEVLVRSGYHVDAVEDGAVAWDALRHNSYDLLVTDHNMPKLTGVELVKKLRAAHSALPVILVTGAMPTDELERHSWLKIDATLLKPFAVAELLGTVTKVLSATVNASEQIASPPSRHGWPSTTDLQL